MRVLIDTTYAARAPRSGTAVYLRALREVLSSDPGVELIEEANVARRPPAGGGAGSVRNLFSDLRFASVSLPRIARRCGAEVVHHPLPAPSLRRRVPQVVTVADLAFERLPGHFDRRFRAYAHLAHREAARRARAVICVSRTTAQDVQELWGVPGERIVVALHGPGQAAALRALAPVRPPAPSHFLYVGDGEPRKNLPTLLGGYALYRRQVDEPFPLVLAGSAQALAAGVEPERGVAVERLAELYVGAAALIQPSLYEGFGLTALEAMSLGTPVLAARSPGLVEVCGDAAMWVEPRCPEGFAHALAKLHRDEQLRGQLAIRGSVRAASFSWADCARGHITAYSLAVNRA